MSQRDAILFVNTRRTTLEAQPCFFAANSLGFDVVLLADHPIPLVPGLAADTVITDTYDHDAALAAAKAVAARRSVVGVLTWGDRDVETVAHIAQGLGLPGNSTEAAAAARNKYQARELLKDTAPHLIPRFHRVRSSADLASAVKEVGFPAILKPTGASSSKGIFQVDDQATLTAAFNRLMEFTQKATDPIFRYYPQELLLEEQLGGTEHSVEGIVVDGRVPVASVTDKWTLSPFYLEYLQIHPSQLDPSTLAQVELMASEVVRALGLKSGAIHLEFRHLPDGALKVLEMNARTGGNFITSHLIPLSWGYDFLGEVIRVSAGAREAQPMPGANKSFAGSIQIISRQAGRFVGFGDLGGALATPGIEHFTYEISPGTEVKQPPDDFVTPILGSFIGRATDPHELRDLLHRAAEKALPTVEAI
ncbi:ATP-grasp domain-containing protein [Frankia sp. Cj3]|uniref:ATP-grasp domain-containing protein n=1 Tax=Frankia sp. Cj3 TaxID=2880976 RepID=UPI001EF56370|nr:ATP-grasp domain-containing protein [Frankia sp. Cj3]